MRPRGELRSETGSQGRAALGAGIALLVLVGLGVAAAIPAGSPLVPGHEGRAAGWAWVYLGAASAAFVAYLVGLALVRARGMKVPAAVAVAVAVQVVPLAGPVLLSTDVYTYWSYGRIAEVHGGNPYADPPSDYPLDPAYARMGAQWRDTTSVYGPAFTLVSEGHAAVVHRSAAAAARLYKALAAVAMIAIVLLAVRLAADKAFAAVFAGWNPLLAFHFAGGGHNDTWMIALVLGAMALAASGRRSLAGVAWVLAIAVKWVAVLFLPLRALEARRVGRPVGHLGFVAAAAVVAGLAFWRYGTEWLGTLGPLASNLDHQARYSIPNRVADLGISEDGAAWLFAALFGLAYLWLLREAWKGRARLALCAGLLLVATPWLVPWYAVWVVPLAAVEEDPPARWLALAISAYLLRDAVPI